MIFIPCRDGISHNEIEYASPEHVEAGANVLLQVMLQYAGGIMPLSPVALRLPGYGFQPPAGVARVRRLRRDRIFGYKGNHRLAAKFARTDNAQNHAQGYGQHQAVLPRSLTGAGFSRLRGGSPGETFTRPGLTRGIQASCQICANR